MMCFVSTTLYGGSKDDASEMDSQATYPPFEVHSASAAVMRVQFSSSHRIKLGQCITQPCSIRRRCFTCAANLHDGPCVGLDVEYIHYKHQHDNDNNEQSAAAWVSMVNEDGTTLLNTYCNPQLPQALVWKGGVSVEDAADAPPLQRVAQAIMQHAAGKLVVGHGVGKASALPSFSMLAQCH
jgi:hypothetical protein